MSVIDGLSHFGGQRELHRSKPQIAAGRVVLPLPADVHHSLHVVLDNFTTAYSFESPAGNWDASGGVPTVGMPCLVVFDDQDDCWVPKVNHG